ncbi:substrate-binding domain-containing protein [Jannaschia aquimarina]|uniref:RbsB_1 protein n=1 Tax=Jannaschia aquimarina TaxID=935700 RepID=A0A0D1EFH8_9RHOB|nr:substrate-binding domain-containing protein [Jannaschia aquimarina]KIT15641.1 D-ribose-binding periplasmic protein precursor [Jannaschia aquimarina]SNT03266.1 monosaccharide ABC transporter substrate-binding protein, CUT2 family [Jannaschia aquimarina]
MINRRTFSGLAATAALALGLSASATLAQENGELVYMTPGLDLAFWRYVSEGVRNVAEENGYGFSALDSTNDPQTQLQNAQDAIARGVAGIILSPTDSSTAPAVLDLAQQAGIPVVIADIGTDSGEFVSVIGSNNYEGANGVGQALAEAMQAEGKEGGSIGIVGISQARLNGQARTQGFKDAVTEAGITGDAGLQQMQAYTADETFRFTQDMITANPQMTGMFVQTDGPTLGALRAIKAARMDGEILVGAFDGIPEFVPLLQSGELVVSGMQQPYLMGQRSAEAMVEHLSGGTPEKEITVPILIVTSENIDEQLDTIRETVFANELE